MGMLMGLVEGGEEEERGRQDACAAGKEIGE